MLKRIALHALGAAGLILAGWLATTPYIYLGYHALIIGVVALIALHVPPSALELKTRRAWNGMFAFGFICALATTELSDGAYAEMGMITAGLSAIAIAHIYLPILRAKKTSSA